MLHSAINNEVTYCHVPLLYNSSQTVRFAHVTNLPLATMRNNILQTQS